MVSQSSFEDVAVRYAPYIRELQDFFSGRGMHFGTPRDMFRLAERVSKPSFFHDEMSSMVRAIVFRERESVTSAELLELIALAIGGPGIENTSQDLHEPIDELLNFLAEVLRSLWGSVPDEIAPAEILPEPVIELVNPPDAEQPQEIEAVLMSPEPSPAEPSAAEPSEPEPNKKHLPDEFPQQTTALSANNGILSRALVMSSDEEEISAEEASVWPRRIWLAAACALFVALSGGLLAGIHHRQPPGAQTATPAVALTDPSPALPSANDEPVSSYNAAEPSLPSGSALDQGGTEFPSATLPPETNAPRNSRHDNAADAHAQSGPAFSTYSRDVETAVAPIAERNAEAASIDSDSSRSAPLGSPSRVARHSDEGVFFVSSGLMTGSLLSAPAPDYPKLAKFTHVQGQVILQVVVSPEGTVAATRVLGGHFLLRSAAEHAVRRWTYRPYIVQGRATDISTIVTVEFRLHQ